MRLPGVLIVALRQYPRTRQAFRHELKTTRWVFKSFSLFLKKIEVFLIRPATMAVCRQVKLCSYAIWGTFQTIATMDAQAQ